MSESRDTRGFCPRCGDPVDRSRTLTDESRGRKTALCDACYLDDFDLVDAPERVEITVCANCGAVRKGNRWVDVGARDYTDVAVDAVTEALGVHVDAEEVRWGVDPEQVDETTIRMHCVFSGTVRGTAVEETVQVPVKIGRGTCERCGRIAGGSYAATIQLRAVGRIPDQDERRKAVEIARETVASREAKGDREAYVSEVRDTDEGLDIRLSRTDLGRAVATQIVDSFGGDFTESETLVTQDGDGNDVYRVAFAIRLPPFRPGDVIDLGDGGEPVIVRSVQGNLKGVRVVSGSPYETATDDEILLEARKLGSRTDAVVTTVVAIEDEHAVQVLDPETFESKTVARPDYLDHRADEVTVLKHREGMHILPEAE